MMIIQLISLAVSVILIENLILEKRFGMERFPRMSRKPRRTVENGLVMLGMMLAAMTAAVLCRVLIPEMLIRPAICTAAFLLILVLLTWLPLRRLPQGDRRRIRLGVCGVNCALLGLWMLETPGVFDTLGAGWLLVGSAGAVAVFLLAGLLFESLHQRLRMCDCPRSFRGVPLEFITAALLMMALRGLV